MLGAPSIRSLSADGWDTTNLNQPRSLGAKGAPNVIHRGPHGQAGTLWVVRGVEVGGGESKDLRFGRSFYAKKF
jgi:hypothetical protein